MGGGSAQDWWSFVGKCLYIMDNIWGGQRSEQVKQKEESG